MPGGRGAPCAPASWPNSAARRRQPSRPTARNHNSASRPAQANHDGLADDDRRATSHEGAPPASPSQSADYLVLRHHSAVGLIDRAESDGLVTRNPDPASRSVVRVTLTAAGARKLDLLAEAHLQELAQLAPTMRALWNALEDQNGGLSHGVRPSRSR